MHSGNAKKDKPQSGFLGNLTASQEHKLKEAHLTLLKTIGRAPLDAKVGIYVKDDQPQGKSLFSFGDNSKSTPEECLSDFKEACGDLPTKTVLSAFGQAARFDHPDALMLRFLRARKWNTAKALVQLGHTLHWRGRVSHIDQVLERGEEFYIKKEKNAGFAEQFTSGKVCLHGHDKHNRPIVNVTVCKHDPKAQTDEEMELFTIYLIETVRLALTNEVSTAVVVFNLEGFGLSNMDYHVVKFLLGCFEQYYPECLGILFIHKAPWVFSGIWSIIKGWIDPVVASKIQFTKKSSDLLKAIDSNQLLDYLGGTSPYKYKYIEPKEGENAYLSKTEERDQLFEKRREMYTKFEDLTLQWVLTKDAKESEELRVQRDELAAELTKQYWVLDPYVRARTISDRDGTLGEFHVELQSGNIAQPTL